MKSFYVKKPLTNIVMFTNLDIVDSTVSSPSAIQFGFLFKSDFESFKKIVLSDIKFRDYEDDYEYEMYGTATPIYKIYIDYFMVLSIFNMNTNVRYSEIYLNTYNINEKENPFNINVIVFSGFYSFWC